MIDSEVYQIIIILLLVLIRNRNTKPLTTDNTTEYDMNDYDDDVIYEYETQRGEY